MRGSGEAAPADRGQARRPDRAGAVERDGVAIAWQVHGDGPDTVLLLPTWSILTSRFWKAQLPYLASHHRVVTFDGRGSGRSDRPVGAAAYSDEEFAADTVAVMDATGTASAVLVGLSCGATWAVHVAAGHPDRVRGVFAIAPSCGLRVSQPEREQYPWDARLDTHRGWARYNRWYWLEGGLEDFRRFFFDQMFHEPHSTKQRDDALDWSADVPAQVLVDSTAGRLGLEGARATPLEPLCAQVRCPVTVLHGGDDRVRSARVGARLAELTGGRLVVVEGSGHGLPAREPVLVNQMVHEFVQQVSPPHPSVRALVRAPRRQRRVLYLSSPIGLGHAARDLAIVTALRRARPDLAIDWLAQEPVTRLLAAAGERVHPASTRLASEVAHIDREAGVHDLHAFSAIRRMDEILVHNYMVFDDLVREQHYDLVVGDEAWDVDHFLHENPERKHFAFAWMTDFVGWLPMPDGGPEEARLTADYNEEMLEHRARYPGVRDRSIFVGNPDDIVPGRFGPDLPDIREWTERNFDFIGYVAGVAPDGPARAALRHSLGYRPEHRMCVVTVGGSGVGEALLCRVLDAVPAARKLMPQLRFLVVCGPRIDPASLRPPAGVQVRGYVPGLAQHLAACDLAVVQGGLGTCMELATAGTPFVYIPLRHHFEQAFHVRHRLERYGAGQHLGYEQACDPDLLADVMVRTLAAGSTSRPVETDGAARAARLLSCLC
ncbi:alpha/beta fold hydrolase [Aeromicrobium wangtongii]|uniref:alpha/beta fold hydrolase n=1 Tax=Aeromicrobium wangtongii TaxID=2969247 RepID=UPI002016E287|nr:alpha/beta fold hydrolase [Aeromicrobium wangtongii]MCL3818983.1 alpha/beta fold hydrolase [Aeromicrobium wangtongii]